jgi:(S)-2-hydroxyglutarate dehydrogenase
MRVLTLSSPSSGRGTRRRIYADLFETLASGGFWQLARDHLKAGWMETYRSLSKRAFVRSLQELIPEVTEGDLVPARAGVRAQALRPDGGLVDDFLIIKRPSSIHVCNAPSPAATASLEIGKEVVRQIPDLRTAVTT